MINPRDLNWQNKRALFFPFIVCKLKADKDIIKLTDTNEKHTVTIHVFKEMLDEKAVFQDES